MLAFAPIVDGSGDETIVFIQGWPDDASLWDPAVAALRDRYRCVRLTLPNYGGDRTSRWGYSTEEIVEALVSFVREADGGKPVTLVLHDWGSYWGHVVHHRLPEMVTRVAGIDVAPHYEPSLRAGIGIMMYQSWLFWAFAVGGPIGNWMTRRFARVAQWPFDANRLHAWMNYPYRNIWPDLITGRAQRLTRGYWPKCPILFAYGEGKPFHFHSAKWVDHVRSVGGEVTGLPCGHWVPCEPAFVDVLTRWLSATSGRG